MVYTKTVWVASTAPGISATNLNNLETQYDESATYTHAQKSSSTPLIASSIGVIGTSSGFTHGDHQHPYCTHNILSASVTGSVLAHSISGSAYGGDYSAITGGVVKRSGTYHVHMVRDNAAALTLSLIQNGGSVGGVALATTAETNVGDIVLTAGATLYLNLSGSQTNSGVYHVLFYNADGWW